MHQCVNCRKSFAEEPYVDMASNPYCSEECLPGAPGGSLEAEYRRLVACLRQFSRKKDGIRSLKDRVDLEQEMDERIRKYRSVSSEEEQGSPFFREQIGSAGGEADEVAGSGA